MYNYIDFNKLFDNESDYGKKMNCGELDDNIVKEVEEKIGYKIPKSYYQFLQRQNGGLINSDIYDECWLETIFGIGKNNENGISDMFDNWINEWGYPNIGIPFGMTQSGGHDIYFMDFSVTDSNDEPRIVLIDNECGNQISFVANNFEEFIKMVYNNEDIGGTILLSEGNIENSNESDTFNLTQNFVPDISALKFAIIGLRVLYIILSYTVIYGIIKGKFESFLIFLVILDILSIVGVIFVRRYIKKINN